MYEVNGSIVTAYFDDIVVVVSAVADIYSAAPAMACGCYSHAAVGGLSFWSVKNCLSEKAFLAAELAHDRACTSWDF